MTDANNDPIGNALNMTPLMTNTIKELEVVSHDDSAARDFEYARSNLYQTIETAQQALATLSQIADQSQHPRSFEVLSALVKTIVDANKDLLALQKNIRELKDADTPHNEKAKIINQSIFVGSTSELQKIIQDLNKNK